METRPSNPPPLPTPAPQGPVGLQRAPQSIGDDAGIRMLIPVGRSGYAIAAGYFGLFSIIPIFAPFALLFGILAIRDINRSKGSGKEKHGMGRAIFGIVMGVLCTLFLIALIVGHFTGDSNR